MTRAGSAASPARVPVAALLLVIVAGLAAPPARSAASEKPAAAARAKRPQPTATTADCPEPAVVVQRLQARYDTTQAFRADFRQETKVAAMGASEEAHGTVAFKKPGKMRWEYATPERQSIVSDGTTLWIYQPADRQALRAPFKAAFVSTTPVSFLAGVGRITDDFRPELDPRGCTGDRIYVRLVAKSQTDLGSIAFVVDRATFDIVGAEVSDPLGNVTALGFANSQRNVEIPDGEFHFEVPPGVDVVGAPGAAPP